MHPKTATNPKGAGRPKTPKTDQAYEEITKAQAEGRPLPSKKELAKKISVSHMAVEKAWDRVRQEQVQVITAEQALAKATFSDKSKLTIEEAIRIHKRRLDKQFEQRVNEEVRRRIAVADDATRANNKALRLENINLQRIVGQYAVFTKAQFRQLQILCHPDNSASPQLRAELLQILIQHERRLVKPELPTLNKIQA
jgi:DNA-binding transcriptional regulator YhcF (GntR family)